MFILKLAEEILLLPVWLILFVIGLVVKMTVQTYAVDVYKRQLLKLRKTEIHSSFRHFSVRWGMFRIPVLSLMARSSRFIILW